jgi:hypothetical protein
LATNEQTNPRTRERADVVSLVVPLTPRHAATARVVAASLAADAGFSVDEIDDFRLGINEAVAVLTDDVDDTPGDATLEVRLDVSDRRIDVVVRRVGGGPVVPPDELADRILSAVLDAHDYHDGEFRLRKVAATARPVDDRG